MNRYDVYASCGVDSEEKSIWEKKLANGSPQDVLQVLEVFIHNGIGVKLYKTGTQYPASLLQCIAESKGRVF